MNQGFWRKWHRWIGFVAAPFLLYAATTGFILAVNEFFGAEEAERERLREAVSPVKVPVTDSTWSDAVSKALATIAKESPGAPVDKLTVDFKLEPPTITVYTGKPAGGEDRKLIIDALTGQLLRTEDYVDKPFPGAMPTQRRSGYLGRRRAGVCDVVGPGTSHCRRVRNRHLFQNAASGSRLGCAGFSGWRLLRSS